MNRNISLLLIGLLLCANVSGQSPKDDFKQALNAKDMVKAGEILKKWDLANSNDPELYVAYFNFFTVKSMEKDSTVYDKQYAQKALEFIADGIDRFPTRLDMRLAQLYMLANLKNYSELTSTLLKLIEYAHKIGNNWKGENFRLIDNNERVFREAIIEFQEKLFAAKDASLYNNIIQISETALKYDPKYVPSMLCMSTVYVTQKQYDKALAVLLKAKDLEPGNAILLYNVAHVYGMKGDKENAKKYYGLTVEKATNKEKPLKDAAQKQFDALK